MPYTPFLFVSFLDIVWLILFLPCAHIVWTAKVHTRPGNYI